MLKVYEEHPESDRFTKFDTDTGRLLTITEEEFRRLHQQHRLETVVR